MSAPASILCANALSYATRMAIRSGYFRPSASIASSYFRSPAPRITIRSGCPPVGGGVPLLVVDPVHDAVEVLPTLVEDSLEPVPVLRGLDFPAVRVGHGGEDVREHQPGLHQVDLPVVLQPLRGEQLPPEAGHREVVVPEQPLVSEVVDGEERSRRPERLPVRVERLHVGGDEGGLPVVAMEDVVSPPVAHDPFHDRAAEKGEPLAVVDVVAFPGAVEELPVEVPVVADEEGVHAAPRVGLLDAPPLFPLPERDTDRLTRPGEGEAIPVHAPVTGENAIGLDPDPAKRLGKGPCDVRQAARFREGNDLGGDHENLHRAVPRLTRGAPAGTWPTPRAGSD